MEEEKIQITKDFIAKNKQDPLIFYLIVLTLQFAHEQKIMDETVLGEDTSIVPVCQKRKSLLALNLNHNYECFYIIFVQYY